MEEQGVLLRQVVIEEAASIGSVEMVLWLRQNGLKGRKIERSCMRIAACNRHLALVRYLNSHGISWDDTLIAETVFAGRFDVLQWLIDQRVTVPVTTVAYCAGMHGRLDILTWLADERGITLAEA